MPDTDALRRHYVTFTFYNVDAGCRRRPQDARDRGRQEFQAVVEQYHDRETMLVLTCSTIGIRGDCDFMFRRIAFDIEPLQEMEAKLLATGLGQYLGVPYSYFPNVPARARPT